MARKKNTRKKSRRKPVAKTPTKRVVPTQPDFVKRIQKIREEGDIFIKTEGPKFGWRDFLAVAPIFLIIIYTILHFIFATIQFIWPLPY